MGGAAARIAVPNHPPCIIMLCGLQGSGKTTHAGKLAYMMRKEGRHPLLVACDVYRPAAIEQLKVVGAKAGVEVFEMGQINPVKITQEALKYAKDHGNDTVIIDTAGRLHIDEALMNELKEVKAAVKPHEIMLVVDAMTGQDAVNVAKSFNEALGIAAARRFPSEPSPASPSSSSAPAKSRRIWSRSIPPAWRPAFWAWATC